MWGGGGRGRRDGSRCSRGWHGRGRTYHGIPIYPSTAIGPHEAVRKAQGDGDAVAEDEVAPLEPLELLGRVLSEHDEVDVERHGKGPVHVGRAEAGSEATSSISTTLDLWPFDPLDAASSEHANSRLHEEGLGLAEGGIAAGARTGLRYQSRDVRDQIAPRGEEDEAVDGSVEASAEEEGPKREHGAGDGEDGRRPQGDLHRAELCVGEGHGRRCQASERGRTA